MRLAVIPARGGSKRIPRKNIRIFIDKPIIAYSILAAKASGCFDKIIVSTDDKEIAEVATKYGAEVPFIRPESLSDDYTGTNDVVKHAIRWYLNKSINIEYACCIYATAPLLQPVYIKEGLNKLKLSGKSFSFSVTSFPYPIQRAVRIVKDNSIEAIFPEYTNTRSQDLEETYHDAAQFYWGKTSAFLDNEVMFSKKSVPVILPRYLVQDIDTVEDWQYCEALYRVNQLLNK